MPTPRGTEKTPPRRCPELDGKTFLICIGAMKAATSWVYAHLRETPGVAVSPLKELQFFNVRFPRNAIYDADLLAMKRLGFHVDQPGDPVKNLQQRPAFQASVDRARMIYDDNGYFEHFARLVAPDTRVVADLTPAYAAIGEEGFRFMRNFCASQDISLKVLFILRDPVQRLWSHLCFLPQFDPGFDPERDWEGRLRDPATMARSDYRATFEALDLVFPPEDIIVFFYETLFDRGFADLCRRLDLSPPRIDADRRHNETERKPALPAQAARALREALDPQYAFCQRRFGNALPPFWRGERPR